MSRWAGCAPAAALALLLVGRFASAAENDFLADNDNWNGLSALVRLATGLQIQTLQSPTLDWNKLTQRDVLLLIHPTVRPDPESFLSFIRRGGRAIVADDFGRSDQLLARLGIERHAGTVFAAGRFHLQNPALPLAVAPPADRPTHPLVRGIPYLLTNHPGYFSSAFRTLLGFGDGVQQVLVAGQLGRGSFVALSDPSVLINAMLRFEHNTTFATNLLRHTCRASQDRLVVVSGFFAQRGLPASAAGRSGKPFAERVNALLARANDFAFTAAGMRALALLVAGLVGCALLLLLPLHRRPLTRSWFSVDAEDLGVAADAGRDSAAERARYDASVALRAVVEQRLGAALGLSDLASALDPAWVLQRVERLAGRPARSDCQALLAYLAQFPAPADRPGAMITGAARSQPAEALRQTYVRADRLFRALGAEGLPPLERSH